MKNKIIKFAVLFSIALTFTSCINVKRDIKFYPNGSGTETVIISFDKSFFDTFETYASLDNSGNAHALLKIISDNTLWQNTILTDLQKTSGTSVKELSVVQLENGGKEIIITYTFDEPTAIIRSVKEVTFPFTNKTNVIWATLKFLDDKDKLKFKYVLRKAERSFSDSIGLSVFSELINTGTVSYNIDMAFQVLSTNSQSQSGNLLSWEFPLKTILFDQAEMTAEMVREEGLDLTYAEKVEKIEKVDKNKNPLIRVQVYNANLEPVKIGTGIILADNLLVTNFKLLNIIDGGGYFSIRLNNDSLAGIDEMKKNDIVEDMDLVFLRFNNNEKVKTLKFATLDVKKGEKVKILYYPNTLSSVVYAIDGTVVGTKKWLKDKKIIEVKPSKPLSLDGGAVFNENGEFLGLLTLAFDGEVGKLYAIPSLYIRSRIPK